MFENFEHGWKEQRCFHPRDDDLRAVGFKIVRRPRYGPAIWNLKGVEFTQEEAEQHLHALRRNKR